VTLRVHAHLWDRTRTDEAVSAVEASAVGKVVQVTCDAEVIRSPTPPPPGHLVNGWTIPGGATIHLLPGVCNALSLRPGAEQFAHAVATLIHESAHARGVRREDCAEMYADLVVFDVLRQFYGVSFFTSLSEQVGRQVYDQTRGLAPMYQPQRDSSST
jgi:hypothetical protein